MEGIKHALSQSFAVWGDNDALRKAEKIVGATASLDFAKAFLAETTKVIGQPYIEYMLQGAVKNNNWPVLDYLLTMAGEYELDYALQGALEGGHLGWVYFFLGKGVELDKQSIEYAAYGGNKTVIDFVMSKTTPEFIFGVVGAIRRNDKELVDYFLNLFTPTEEDSDRALRTAAGKGHLELVHYFVQLGATDFSRAAFLAAKNGHLQTLKVLLSKVAKEKMQNTISDALSIAIYNENWAVAKYLMAQGAKTHVVPEYIELLEKNI